MLRNYLKIAIRNLRQQKAFSFINIIGLTLGLTCCFLILLFVSHELSYDRFHEKADRIYRVTYNPKFAGVPTALVTLPTPAGPLIASSFPEVEQTARLFRRSASIEAKEGVAGRPDKYEEERFFFGDPAIFKIFTVTFLQGNSATALRDKFSVVITDKVAEKYFGSGNVLGKTLTLDGQYPMTVTGVIKALPDNSHVYIDLLANYETMFATISEGARENLPRNWVISHSLTYVLLKPGQSAATVNAKFPQFLLTHANERFAKDIVYELQPLTDIHLRSNLANEVEPTGRMDYVYIFIGVAIITLLIACINFVNLATARSLKRAREVGMRKVMGAGQFQLIGQFLGESLLLCFIAFGLSLVLINLMLPVLNHLTGKELTMGYLLGNGQLLAGFVGIALLTGLLAGSYPAFFVARFLPIQTLKGSFTSGKAKGGMLRQTLMVVQFTASVALIIGTITTYRQLRYVQEQPLGFNKEYVITIPFKSNNLNNIFDDPTDSLFTKLKSLKDVLRSHPQVEQVALSSGPLGLGGTRRGVVPEGFARNDNLFATSLATDYDFIKTYGLKLVAGREFSRAYGTDQAEAFIVNESAVKQFKWGSPARAIGRQIELEGKTGKVVGVVNDFHMESLQQPIEGLVLDINPSVLSMLSVKIRNQNIPQTLAFVEKQWGDFFPQKVFEYDFLDKDIARLYERDQRLGNIVAYFAVLAMFISCLGLYGLVVLVTQQRVREVGIRKVLGASVTSIVALFSLDFLKLVLVAILIASPIAWYAMNGWLKDFAYRVDIDWWIFVAAGLLVALIALLTVSIQSIRAALMNPVKSLRTE
ncbi:ABC transporter permease [Nibrella saemangeumensis]|uniref:ABC transporter permease n=1 Tax=Nibrella saemangeumensis TaxID=1084526 RepID=A0ABP8M9I2_9BACT